MKKLLIISQIGSPDAPEAKSVGKYLKKFLMDPRIITAPFLIRWFLVHVLIVPRRRFASAEKYHNIWSKQGSPLVLETLSFAEKLKRLLNKNIENKRFSASSDSSVSSISPAPGVGDEDQWEVVVHWRYGEDTAKQVQKWREKFFSNQSSVVQNSIAKNCVLDDISEIYIAPMYPQYAEATTLSALDVLLPEIKKHWNKKTYVLKPFYAEPEFIAAWVDKIKTRAELFDQVLFSFHGLPQSQVLKIDGCRLDSACCEKPDVSYCYPAQCKRTVKQIVAGLREHGVSLKQEQYSLTYQSRVGPTKWLEPATDKTVQDLVTKRAVSSLLVVCPAFVTDGLETLEEINMELRGQFKSIGGKYFEMCPSLNDDSQWVSGFHSIMQRENSWRQA